jgi:putative phosphoesterase
MVDYADAVVHLGDFSDELFARRLKRRCRLYAVCGNADPYPLRVNFPVMRIVHFDGVKAALMHRFSGPWSVAQVRAANYASIGVSLILFGHTHNPEDITISGVRMLNPGSAGDGRRTKGRYTAGMLEINRGRIQWELWPLGREVLV